MSSLDHKKSAWIAITLVIFCGLAVRAFLFNGGIRGSDAFAYAQYAHDIATSGYDISQIKNFYGFRYILLIPTALSYYLFGVNDISSSLFSLLCSLLNIVVIFVIAKRIFNLQTALLAAILLVFYPLDIASATLLGPDSAIPLLSSLAVLCYLMVDDEVDGSKRVYFFLFAGLFIGLSMSARLTSVFLYGVLCIDQVIRRRRAVPVLWILLGLMIPIAAEALYYYSLTDDALYRIHQIAHLAGLVKGLDPDAIVSLWFYPKVMFGFDLKGLACYGFTWWMVAAGFVWASSKRDGRVLFLAIWLLLPFLGFEFGTQSLNEMIPIMKNYNYLSLITGPAVIMAAYFLVNFGEFLSSKVNLQHVSILAMLVIVIAGTNGYGAYRLSLNLKDDAAPYIVVADYLKIHQAKIVYTHHSRWPLFLNYFLRYPDNLDFRDLNKLTQTEMKRLSGAYIILHKRYLEADTAGRQYRGLPWYARYVDSSPSGWEGVLSVRGRPEYNNVTMYYVK
jgi:4-amino-4-deoxy-L-arabinose transferase-like glycosyltransferase